MVGNPRWRTEGEQSLGIYNLKIRNASLSDDGEYQCQVGPNGGVKPIRTNARLTVLCKYRQRPGDFPLIAGADAAVKRKRAPAEFN